MRVWGAVCFNNTYILNMILVNKYNSSCNIYNTYDTLYKRSYLRYKTSLNIHNTRTQV